MQLEINYMKPNANCAKVIKKLRKFKSKSTKNMEHQISLHLKASAFRMKIVNMFTSYVHLIEHHNSQKMVAQKRDWEHGMDGQDRNISTLKFSIPMEPLAGMVHKELQLFN